MVSASEHRLRGHGVDELQRRTSEGYPIYADFVSGEDTRTPGGLGMTLAPGMKADTTHGEWRWERDLKPDLRVLRETTRTGHARLGDGGARVLRPRDPGSLRGGPRGRGRGAPLRNRGHERPQGSGSGEVRGADPRHSGAHARREERDSPLPRRRLPTPPMEPPIAPAFMLAFCADSSIRS